MPDATRKILLGRVFHKGLLDELPLKQHRFIINRSFNNYLPETFCKCCFYRMRTSNGLFFVVRRIGNTLIFLCNTLHSSHAKYSWGATGPKLIDIVPAMYISGKLFNTNDFLAIVHHMDTWRDELIKDSRLLSVLVMPVRAFSVFSCCEKSSNEWQNHFC